VDLDALRRLPLVNARSAHRDISRAGDGNWTPRMGRPATGDRLGGAASRPDLGVLLGSAATLTGTVT
jgi:hypothetical protein